MYHDVARLEVSVVEEMRLGGGVVVRMYKLEQTLTYHGLLEGLPTRERNDERLARARAAPRTYVVPPEQEPIDIGRTYPFGTPASLPRVECVAHVRGSGWQDAVLFETIGRVVWFQASWAMPVAPEVLAHLEGVDWRTFAQEYEV